MFFGELVFASTVAIKPMGGSMGIGIFTYMCTVEFCLGNGSLNP